MKRLTLITALLLLVAAAPFLGAAPSADRTTAIINARIVPVTGPEIARGTIIIKNGLIEAVGADVAVPSGAATIDAAGLTAYPGMIDAYSTLGLVEISGVQSTVDNRETGRYNPQARAIEAIRYDSMHIPIARSNGVTAAMVVPTGGVIAGQSCLIRLDGWTNREMAVKDRAAFIIEMPAIQTGRRGFGGFGRPGEQRLDTPKTLEELGRAFTAARSYEKRKAAAAKNIMLALPEYDDVSEALMPLLHGEMPAVFSVHADKDILAVLKFVKDQNIKAVLYGAEQGFKVADEIAKAGVPVIIESLYELPPVPEDGYDALFLNPVKLSKAGVKIAFASSNATEAKDLPYQAAKAAAFGLDKAEALKAVTIYPAQIFGVDKIMGSLEKGKSADIVLADNDILEMRTNIKYVFIKGHKTDLSNRYTELLDKFSKRGQDND